MLIKCPECDLQVSDRAFACPHCGYPLKEQPKPVRKSSRKRRRLPNGFGQISELKGRNLRKPFRAMVTVGKTPRVNRYASFSNQKPSLRLIMMLMQHLWNTIETRMIWMIL